jgi:hypothetical protein
MAADVDESIAFAHLRAREIADTTFYRSFPHHSLKRIAAVALPVLNLKLIIATSAIGSRKLSTDRAEPMPWHLMP